jgi:hypothetical protein
MTVMMTRFTTAGNLITISVADWHILHDGITEYIIKRLKDQTFKNV